MKYVNVSIKGASPLIVNCPNLSDEYEKNRKTMSEKEFLEYQFKTKQYRNADGKLYLPAWHILAALVQAGKHFRMKKKGKRNATYEEIVACNVIVEPPEILHKITKLEKFTGSLNPMNASKLCRPILRDWEVDFQLAFDEAEISKETLRIILDRAGGNVGTGDLRTQHWPGDDWRAKGGGPYGTFFVTKFEEV